VDFPGPAPGPAEAKRDGERLTLHNRVLSVTWKLPADQAGVALVEVADRLSGGAIAPREPAAFAIQFDTGPALPGAAFRVQGKPQVDALAATPRAVCAAERAAGQRATATLVSADGALRVQWQATLRDGSHYVRQEFAVQAVGKESPVRQIQLLNLGPLPSDARTEGVVEGSPIVAGNWFLGAEHPMAANRVAGGVAECSVGTFGVLRPGQPCTRSCVIGVAPAGQMRRAFLCYLERERARPYQPFLHYNSWYDIAWGDRKMNEAQCLAVIDLYARELVAKRGVTFDSFVFDDGWDDNKTLWRFHEGFPRGFTPLTAAARQHRSAVGVWLSPWGGYGQAQKERLQYGASQGFETNKRGFSLAGPRYYGRFREVCAEMVQKYDVNYFKYDGIAQGIDSAGAGAAFAGDVDALLRLLADLRGLRPDLFINVTTGTWPSPFWLRWADSIWRNGGDMGFFGPGSKRQQWITYRDMIEYRWIVRRGPLYPVSSLMTQGIAQARLGDAAKLGADLAEWKDEVRSFFASGTQLQELYVTPQLLTPEMWDVLAEGARWSRERADVLADVHWIGGDPGQGQPYGFAAWSPARAMLALRNPTDRPASIVVDVGAAFELPAGAAQAYRLRRPWADGPEAPPEPLQAGRPHTFSLPPFAVLVFDATP
jgi:hypothetical protein